MCVSKKEKKEKENSFHICDPYPINVSIFNFFD